jgi:hypothetical protein
MALLNTNKKIRFSLMLNKVIAVDAAKEKTKVIQGAKASIDSRFVIPTGFLIGDTRLIAEVNCDFTLKPNPNTDRMIEWVVDLAIEKGIYPANDPVSKGFEAIKQSYCQKIKASYFVDLALNTIPDSTNDILMKKMALWVLTLFAYDNLIDDSRSSIVKDRGPHKELLRDLTAALKGDKTSKELLEKWTPRLFKIDATHLNILSLWIEQMHDSTPGTFQFSQTFLTEAEKYFLSSLDEMEDVGTAITTSKYIDTRRFSGAVLSVIALAESDLKPLPFYLREDLHYQQLLTSIVDYVWAVNDIGSAKEWKGHEPNYLKVCYGNSIATATKAGVTAINKFALFESAFIELIDLINDNHQTFLKTKIRIIERIQTGEIFDKDPALKHTDKQILIRDAIADFEKRCRIMEYLAVAGNQCTAVSSRYVDPKDPSLNVDLGKELGEVTV